MTFQSFLYKTYYESKAFQAWFRPIVKVRRMIVTRRQAKLRSLLDNLEKYLVEDPIVHLDEFGGDFSIDPKSDLFKRYMILGCYEPRLANLCREFVDINKDVIDVGANIGFFSVLFGNLVSEKNRVLAIEPTSLAIKRLEANLKRNGVEDKITVFKGVASKEEGLVTICTVAGKEEYSSIGNMAHPSIEKVTGKVEEVVKSSTVDKLIEKFSMTPGFVKVDVEGVEHLVFQGMEKCLSKHRPIVLSELSDYLLRRNGSSAQEVVSMFEGYDYLVIDPVAPNVRVGSKEFGDMLCIPNEMAERMLSRVCSR